MGHLFKVLGSPQATFERIREEKGASWVAAFLVLSLLTVITFWLSSDTVLSYTEATLRHQAQLSGNQINEATLNMTKTTTLASGYVGGFLGVALRMFIGGLLLLLVNLFVRGEARYMQLSKVALYSSVPGVIQGLLIGLLARTTGATSPYDVAINAGVFFADKKGWGFALASLLDPFQLYGVVLLIIGTAVVARRPRKKVAVWVILGWLIISILGLIGIAMQK